jgi:hypothetical protein
MSDRTLSAFKVSRPTVRSPFFATQSSKLAPFICKSFLVLFFKKEQLPSLAQTLLAQAP